MPQAKRSTRSSTRSASFREPAALKRLNKSLDGAQEALAELRKSSGRHVGQGARDVYKDLRTFIGSARRDTGKLGRALRRDFEQAEKRLSGGRTAQSSRAGRATGAAKRTSTAAKRPRAGSKRSTSTGR